MSDEQYYLQAANEYESEERNEALWIKSITLCDGDDERAKYTYIKIRVEQLLALEKDKEKQVKSDVDKERQVERNLQAQAKRRIQAISEGLHKQGYQIQSRSFGKGWVILEPYGGKVVLKTWDAVEEYAASRIPVELRKPTSSTEASQEDKFSKMANLVQMSTEAAQLPYMDAISTLSPEQARCHLAFQLGIIEYFDRAFFPNIANSKSGTVNFINFLIYYSNAFYGDSSEPVLEFWRELVSSKAKLNERELGFNSVNDSIDESGAHRAGHYPPRYLGEALGL